MNYKTRHVSSRGVYVFESMVKIIRMVAWAVPCMAGTVATAADWQIGQAMGGSKAVCALNSAKNPVHDGYQQVSAQIIVDKDVVIVKSDSILDPSFSDIGMRVGDREFVPMDKVRDQKQAVFESNYSKIVQQFKEGREVNVQLRFWPTWPATGTHSVSFSLMGFTKAYAEALNCK